MAQMQDDIDAMDLSPELKVQYNLAILDGSPDLLDKLPEIEQMFGKQVADDYRARWYQLYKDTDELVDLWNIAQK